MEIDIPSLQTKSKREIIRDLVEYVVTSEEEFEEKETRSGSRTDLNLYVADNQGFEFGELHTWLHQLEQEKVGSGYAANFVRDHTFEERQIGEKEISLITITTPDKNREDEFLFIANNGYVWALTTTRRDWRETTIENLLKYLPCLERLYLSSDDLETLARDISDSSISGFTAKYHAPHRKRDATLTFSGAEPEDLAKAEETYNAKPTRIEFDQRNSPATAIQGANTNDGRITLRSVIDGSEPKAVETLLGLTEEYQDYDRRRFEVDHSPIPRELENGFSVEGFTSIELVDPDRERSESENLNQEIIDHVLNSNKYRYGLRDGGSKIRIYDLDYDELFDVALEPPNIIVYVRESTTALSVRGFVKSVYDDLDSTYSLQKQQSRIATQ